MLNDEEYTEYRTEREAELNAWDYAFEFGTTYEEAYQTYRGKLVRGAYQVLLAPGLKSSFQWE